MRIEIAGAQVTEAVVEVLDTLQNDPYFAQKYIDTIDRITREILLDTSGEAADDADPSATLTQLRVLQQLRSDILTLSMPPDIDDPENDVATASF